MITIFPNVTRLEYFLQKAPVNSIWTGVVEINFSEKRSFRWQLLCSIFSPPVAIGSPVICTENVNRQAEDEILLGSSLFYHTSHTIITHLLLYECSIHLDAVHFCRRVLLLPLLSQVVDHRRSASY